MPSCNTYHLTWVSLTLEEGYLLTATLPDLQRGIAPLGPPAPLGPLSHFSCVLLYVTLWTVVCQTPLSMRFSKNTGVGCHALLQGSSQPRD